jgi:excisionase family DNA binding protein
MADSIEFTVTLPGPAFLMRFHQAPSPRNHEYRKYRAGGMMSVIRRGRSPKDRGGDTMRPKPPAPELSETAGLLSTGQVARLFGVSPSTVTRWARLGILNAIRTPGGHFRFRERDARRALSTPDELGRLD